MALSLGWHPLLRSWLPARTASTCRLTGLLPAYTPERLRELRAKNIDYRSRKYSEYEISQMRRALERRVRGYKKQFLAEDAAGVDAGRTAVKLTGAERQLAQFISETGGKVNGARTGVSGFGRSETRKAEAATDRFYAEKSASVGVGSPTADLRYINSDAYKQKFLSISDDQQLNHAIYVRCRAAITHQSGGYYEDLSVIHMDGSLLGQTSSATPNETLYTEKLKRDIASEPEYSLISIHNHGTNLPPSGSDLGSAGYRKYAFGIVACHDGTVFLFDVRNARPFSVAGFDMTVDKYQKPPYTYNKVHAMEETLAQFARDYGIDWRKLI